MVQKKKRSPAKKRAETIGKRIEKNKKDVLKKIEKVPVFAVAVRQAGVGISTFYRWLQTDPQFKKDVEESYDIGSAFINDLAESKVIGGIHRNDKTMIIFWLKNRHRLFSDKRYHEHYFREEQERNDPLTEERKAEIARALKAWSAPDPK